MSVIIVDVAGPGSGKTERSIQVGNSKDFRDLNKMVVDPEREYVLYSSYKQIDPTADIVKVLNQTWLIDTFLIIDCANYKFPVKGITEQRQTELYEALGGARHRGNSIYLNFHALKQVPSYIRTYIDQMTLGHTHDPMEVVRNFGYKDSKLKEVFKWLQTKQHKKHACDTF